MEKGGLLFSDIGVYSYQMKGVATKVNIHRGHDEGSGFGGESQIATRTDDEALKGERDDEL